MKVNVAHSPDADDHFLFWPLKKRLINTNDVEFSFTALDTEDLNRAAENSLYEVIAISVAAYRNVFENYLILPHGASVGRNYGPVIVATSELGLEQLNHIKIGIPGQNTTAALLLKHLAPKAKTVEIPLSPYQAVFEALRSGRIQAAVLIHEGQIAYSAKEFSLILDLGKWWQKNFGTPLPLGINIIKKSLGYKKINLVSELIRKSIAWSLDNKSSMLEELFQLTQIAGNKLANIEELSRYLSMYANEDSREMKQDCKEAIKLLAPRIPVEFSS